ncbi:MAG: sulfur carrier protein ThiS [Myxococcales bacterium]
MKLLVNGEEAVVPDGLSVSGLLEHLAIRAPRVAVEVNLDVVKRDRHASHLLQEGDRVEIVSFVGGG